MRNAPVRPVDAQTRPQDRPRVVARRRRTGQTTRVTFNLDQALLQIVADLSYRYEDSVSREDVRRIVDDARAELESTSRHPEFLAVLIAKQARDALSHHDVPAGDPQGHPRPIPDVIFLCEHNSARSQMAAAFADHLAHGHIHVRAAGAHNLGFVNPLVERAMKEKGITLHKPFRRGHIDENPVHVADVVVEIGDGLPDLPAKAHHHWVVRDPHGQPLDVVREVRDEIEQLVRNLLDTLGVPVSE